MAITVGEIVQMSFLVDNLDAAMKAWLETRRTGPFLVLRHVDDLPITYRGEPSELDISIGFAQMGPIHIELIEQHNVGESAYRDIFAPGQSGFHHVCIPVADIEAARQNYIDAGHAVAMDLEFGGTPVSYIDTFASLGCMTEIVRADPDVLALYASIADAAIGWDGADPIREL
jgi:hypothetical protein